jgi:aspartate carbamoyltransferase
MNGPFQGRSISVVRDLSLDEQWFLYTKTAEIKKTLLEGKDPSPFQISDPNLSVYLIFLEDSTRTKESFRNAALFHRVTVNVFDASSSSFNKQESLSDTLKMLVGYGRRSIFIIRSTVEGVCRHLENYIGAYCKKAGIPQPSFLNAGDGRHEHPSQEFLDEFSFLEQKKWNRSAIHVALIGDLYFGRTVHSKADGLQIFDNVQVDLIAPPELALPEFYAQKMKDHRFSLRFFNSIEAYLSQPDVADVWYFTRLQIERMGDEVLDKVESLKASVTVRPDHLPQLPQGTKFYHPLPQNRLAPTIPLFAEALEVNGWDEQSRNGYFTRITLIGMVGGVLGQDWKGVTVREPELLDDFIEEVSVSSAPRLIDPKTGIKPVDDGIVIDHIGLGRDIEQIWRLLDKIRRNLQLNYLSSQGVFASKKSQVIKGLISIPDIPELGFKKIKKLAALSPGCTLNIVQNKRVVHKYRVHMPPRIYNFEEIACRNENCISHARQHEPVEPEFIRSGDGFVCRYCERPHSFDEIWTS